MHHRFATPCGLALLAGLALAVAPIRGMAAALAGQADPAAGPVPSFADLVDLAQAAPMVLTVEVRKAIALDPARAPSVAAGFRRAYVVARPLVADKGALPAAPGVSFLADVPEAPNAKLPPLAKKRLLLFARPVPEQPAMLQLVAPEAGFLATASLETRVRAVLAALSANDAPPRVTGVREAIHVPGTLDGEGETQLFLSTTGGSPAAIAVEHEPGKPPRWSVSFSEVVDPTGKPPAHDTLAWYRLACALPATLGHGVNVSETSEDRARADADYAQVLSDLGPCVHRRGL